MTKYVDVYVICCDAPPRDHTVTLETICRRITRTLRSQAAISAVKTVLSSDDIRAKCIAAAIADSLEINHKICKFIHDRVIYNDKINADYESGLEFRDRVYAFKKTITADIILVSHMSVYRCLTGTDKLYSDEVSLLTYEIYTKNTHVAHS